jgi:ComF family protein
MNYFLVLQDLIFPRKCLACNTKLIDRDILCNQCLEQLAFIQNTIISEDNAFDLAYALYHFSPLIQSLIHEFKYNDMINIGKFLAVQAVEFIQTRADFPEIDCVIPVPLHRVKKRARGFNQSEVISKIIARNCGFEHLPNVVQRKKFTQTQTMLGRTERKENVSNAFVLKNSRKIKGKNILLVDDVFTTGATVNSISNLLKNNGVSKIYVLTIARA